MELVMECEDEFGIAIPDDEASRIVTVGDLHAAICSKLLANKRPTVFVAADGTVHAEVVWLHLVLLVSTQLGVPIARIRPETRFVEDLHID